MINILDKTYEPSLEEINNFIQGESKKRWLNIIEYINDKYDAKTQICYSKCSAMPGWNVKYKKSSKSICTLYPREHTFTMLIVLNEMDMEWFKGMRDNYTKYILDLYDNCNLFNGTKWLMIEVTDDVILDDTKRLISLKFEK